eukprot:Tbor_TRINITY_DN5097_c5_g2::TRINITY_DN5097_c5_g2_i1::g.14017::m.14017
MGRLDVRICSARNLPDTQYISNPYIVLRCGKQQHKTAVAENHLNPSWEEVFKFHIADPLSLQLRLEMWNKNITGDELMGVYNLHVSSLTKGLVSDQWLLLGNQRCKSNAELRVRIAAIDFGNDPSDEERKQLSLPDAPQVQHLEQQQSFTVVHQQEIFPHTPSQQPVIPHFEPVYPQHTSYPAVFPQCQTAQYPFSEPQPSLYSVLPYAPQIPSQYHPYHSQGYVPVQPIHSSSVHLWDSNGYPQVY